MKHKVLEEGVSPQDLELFQTYFYKHKAVTDQIHSWLRIGLTMNSALLAVGAFLLRPPGTDKLIDVLTLHPQQLAPLCALCLLGAGFSLVWIGAHRNMFDWQLRTNGVLASLEVELLQKELVIPWRSKVAKKDPDKSLEKCAMWNMISGYTPPVGDRSESDVVSRMVVVPLLFSVLWFVLLVLLVIALAVKLGASPPAALWGTPLL